MRFQNLIFIFIVSVVMTGCASCEAETNTNTTPSNENKGKITNSTPKELSNKNVNENVKPTPKQDAKLNVTKTPPPQKENEADTLKPLVNSYCKAVNSKNDAELQKVYSKQAWAIMKKFAKDEGFSSVSKFLDDAERIGNKCSVINEKLSGNTGVAIVSTETYPNGVELKFVKEGNDWKMTTQSTEF